MLLSTLLHACGSLHKPLAYQYYTLSLIVISFTLDNNISPSLQAKISQTPHKESTPTLFSSNSLRVKCDEQFIGKKRLIVTSPTLVKLHVLQKPSVLRKLQVKNKYCFRVAVD